MQVGTIPHTSIGIKALSLAPRCGLDIVLYPPHLAVLLNLITSLVAKS